MKIFISELNKLSLSVGDKTQELHPFYIADDETGERLKNVNGMKEAGELLNIPEIMKISEEIKKNLTEIEKIRDEVINIKYVLSEKLSDCIGLFNSISDMQNIVFSYKGEIKKIVSETEKLCEEIRNIRLNGESEAEKFIKKTEKIVKSVNENLSECLRITSEETEEAINKIEGNIKRYEMNINEICLKTEEEIKKMRNEAAEYAETAKKWAVAPPGVPVINGKFSALHYAKMAGFKNGQ